MTDTDKSRRIPSSVVLESLRMFGRLAAANPKEAEKEFKRRWRRKP